MALAVSTTVAQVISSVTTATTASFNASANTLLVAILTLDGPETGAVTGSMSDTTGGALTWALAGRQNTAISGQVGGSVEVWWAITTAGFTSKTITATNSSGGGAGDEATTLRLLQFTGYAASPIGNTAGTTFAPTPVQNFTQAITTSAANSWIWGGMLNYTRTDTLTANGSSAVLSQASNGDNDEFVGFAQSSTSTPPTAASGTNLTLGGSWTSTTTKGQMLCVEILQALPPGVVTAWLV